MFHQKLTERQAELATNLLQKRNEYGFWEGRLSSSALGTAVSVTALRFNDKLKNSSSVLNGIDWLTAHQNTDGGYGDTPESPSNISTSLLVYASFNIIESSGNELLKAKNKLHLYLSSSGIDVDSDTFADAVLNHYRNDFTFSVPILTMCALCGVPQANGFRKIPHLPFELALLPRSFYRMLNLSVVSYAIPALIAVGIAIFRFKPGKSLMTSWLRRRAVRPALRLLNKLMPESGGFLEAIPLTGFVNICLVTSGYRKTEVAEKGIDFLTRTQRSDGSWPIDIDLSTWVTTLAVKALKNRLDFADSQKLTIYLLNQQNKQVHPFNGAQPGGWGWTNHSGSVPDGDDTPGAIISLINLNRDHLLKVKSAVIAGCSWLISLQNNDGGFPTFARGWGKLPFDKSCADLTGHSVLALALTLESFPGLTRSLVNKYLRSVKRGINYLKHHQDNDGSLLPLWFGNQMTGGHLNPVYGTARVISYLGEIADFQVLPQDIRIHVLQIIAKGKDYLQNSQNSDGSWGGGKGIAGSIEETALALGALAGPDATDACIAAVSWLDNKYNDGYLKSTPIGLYFASLWYDEELYPYTSYLEGLTRCLEKFFPAAKG